MCIVILSINFIRMLNRLSTMSTRLAKTYSSRAASTFKSASNPVKVVIVGGVAGGASAAARLRRNNENANIVLFEKGPDISVATCGMPYHFSGEIERENLVVLEPDTLRKWFNVDLRLRSEVMEINCEQKKVVVSDIATGKSYEESYDKLILSPGAKPIRPPVPGNDLPGIYPLHSLGDLDRIKKHIDNTSPKHATVIGAGFIGLELVENFRKRGLDTALVEMADQVLPPLDKEMTLQVDEELRKHGVDMYLKKRADRFDKAGDGRLNVTLNDGTTITTDLVMVCVGIRPNSEFASKAGIMTNPRGMIKVNEHMQTSDPDVYAVGDLVEVRDWVPREKGYIPLAGPANRQGRVAADHICGRGDAMYRGTQGSAITRVFDVVVACTGAAEKTLQKLGWAYDKVYTHNNNHAAYYPGAMPLHLKVTYEAHSGRILGAQCIGAADGVDKRVDVLSAAIQAKMTVFDLEEMELCYAPPFNSAKDPINMAGFIAAGTLRGEQVQVHVEDLKDIEAAAIIDVRSAEEFAEGHLPNSINIPLDALRDRTDELEVFKGKGPIVAYCRAGMRGYVGTRMLRQLGYECFNLSGGIITAYHHGLHDKFVP